MTYQGLVCVPLSRNGNSAANSLLGDVVLLLFQTGAQNWSINSLTPSALLYGIPVTKNHKTMTDVKEKFFTQRLVRC